MANEELIARIDKEIKGWEEWGLGSIENAASIQVLRDCRSALSAVGEPVAHSGEIEQAQAWKAVFNALVRVSGQSWFRDHESTMDSAVREIERLAAHPEGDRDTGERFRCPECRSTAITNTADGQLNCDNCKRRWILDAVSHDQPDAPQMQRNLDSGKRQDEINPTVTSDSIAPVGLGEREAELIRAIDEVLPPTGHKPGFQWRYQEVLAECREYISAVDRQKIYNEAVYRHSLAAPAVDYRKALILIQALTEDSPGPAVAIREKVNRLATEALAAQAPKDAG